MSPEAPIVDLRSDTVTRPTAAMRRAMAEAIVGDDVFGDDPTVKELERRVAGMTGKEAALYVPSGTMGNQIAVMCHTRPGEEVLLEQSCHILMYEQGGMATNAGALAHPLASERGAMAADAVIAAIRGEDDHVARVRLLCIENTHNRAGGAIVPLDRCRALSAAARERGLAVHLDGARLWNASVATGIALSEWAQTADTVMMCFSKALGAPVGSILVGDGAVIHQARRYRKRLGGGMRQVGVLAAACLHALDHHIARLADDHHRAQALAGGFRQVPGVKVAEPDTNIVIVELEHPALQPDAVLAGLKERGIWMVPFGGRRLRAIAHLDVDDSGVERAITGFHEAVGALAAR